MKYKEMCHYSKTGWAWSRHPQGACTCVPCPAPKKATEIVAFQRTMWKKANEAVRVREMPI